MLSRNALTGLVVVSLAAAVGFPLHTAVILAPSFSRLVIENAEKEAERAASHLSGIFFPAGGPLVPQDVTSDLRARVAGQLRELRLREIKAYDRDGRVFFATDPEDEGTVNSWPYFRDIVATGKRHTTLDRRGQRSQEGKILDADVVECYVPILKEGSFLGALEVYYDVTEQLADVHRLLRRTNVIVLAMGAVLAGAVAVAFRRAARAARERDRVAEELRAHRDRLEQTVAERTASLREANAALEQDIARRSRTEEALRESEERASAIAGSSPDGIFVLDQDGRVEYLNAAAEAMFGYPRQDAVGKVFHEIFVSPAARVLYERFLPEFKATGRCTVMDGPGVYTATRSDGTTFPVELCVVAVHRRDAWHAVGTVRDISDRRAAEEERERLISELTDALENIKVLSGIVPVCSACKKIRGDQGYWTRLEEFLAQNAEVEVSQELCPDCAERIYPHQAGAAGPETAVQSLTRREREVLSWVRHGKSTWEIAAILEISERTVKFHVTSIMRKLNAFTRAQAVAVALEFGLLEPNGSSSQSTPKA